jgi:hypothetical protein
MRLPDGFVVAVGRPSKYRRSACRTGQSPERGRRPSGITLMDNCGTYYDGKIANSLGGARRPGRAKLLLMTKLRTHAPSAQLALRMLEES